jgi:capsular polysaccharide transport system permease protein
MLMEALDASVSTERERGFAARARRWVIKQRWFILLVILPVLASTVYYGLIASDIYVSEARFVIKSPDQKRSTSPSLANLIQTTGLSAGEEQTNEVLDYVRSRNALVDLSKSIDVRAAFMRPEADRLSGYPPILRRDTFERLYKYYGTMVGANLDHDTNLAVLKVKAFTPKDARAMAAGLLDLSENLVNRLNARAQTKQIAEAEARVREAEGRVRNARITMRQYRNTERLLDPSKEATGVLQVSTELTAQRAALQAQLQAIQAGAPRNPSIPALRSRIAAIDAQISGQAGRATGTSGGLASKLTQYENLLVEQEFAAQMFNTANASLEQSRAEALRQQFYLERVVEPNTPDMALLPSRLNAILTVAGVCLCLYMVGWMLIVGILEHRPES